MFEMRLKVNKKIEKIFTLLQSKVHILKVVVNAKKGSIKVYNKRGKIIIKKTNLTKEQVKIVEESFLNFVAKKLNDINTRKKEKNDPMIA